MQRKENQSQERQSGCFGDGRRKSESYSTPTPAGSVFRRQLDQFEPELAHAGMAQTDFPGDTIGYINFAPFLIRTPVIDTYKFELATTGVHYPDEGPKGEVRVRRRECFGVEMLSVGGLAPVKPGAIPAGIAHPSLDRLYRLTQMRDEGGLHRRSDEEHKKHPAKSSPTH